MTDLTARLQDAAAAAIADIAPAIERDADRVRMLTFEVELGNKGQVVGARAWVERGCNIGRLLGDRGPR